MDAPPTLLRNVNPDHHHWVEMALVGGGKTAKSNGSPRDATCATVYLKANGMRMRQDVMASGSYISANDPRLHFGLGDATDAGTRRFTAFGAREMVKLPRKTAFTPSPRARGLPGRCAAARPAQPQLRVQRRRRSRRKRELSITKADGRLILKVFGTRTKQQGH